MLAILMVMQMSATTQPAIKATIEAEIARLKQLDMHEIVICSKGDSPEDFEFAKTQWEENRASIEQQIESSGKDDAIEQIDKLAEMVEGWERIWPETRAWTAQKYTSVTPTVIRIECDDMRTVSDLSNFGYSDDEADSILRNYTVTYAFGLRQIELGHGTGTTIRTKAKLSPESWLLRCGIPVLPDEFTSVDSGGKKILIDTGDGNATFVCDRYRKYRLDEASFWNCNSEIVKQIKFRNYRQINGFWIPGIVEEYIKYPNELNPVRTIRSLVSAEVVVE